MSLKYKVGDKVKIKSIDWYNKNKNKYGRLVSIGEYQYVFDAQMSKFCGKVMTISDKSNSSYMLKEDDAFAFWTDDMIECKVGEEIKPKFKTGDRVFNKVTRKLVNIIDFDLEKSLYIVRYDDGTRGRSLENEMIEDIK